MQNRSILKNKLYLYFTEFFSGLAVMAVELGASRLLAPFFSSSQIVWTIIIGTIMIAMALGNIYGGRSADKDPDPDRLYRRILIAAVWIAAIPVLGKYIILGISAVLVFSVNTNFLIWAAFAACMIIFVFPLFLLGTVTPSLARYTVQSIDESGKVVGTLGAFNTVGSIIGTFLPTFVTIPAVGTAVSFLIFSGVLLAISLIYYLSSRIGYKKCIFAVIAFILCCVFGHNGSFAFWQDDLAYEGESVYNYLQVKENEEEKALSTNVLFGVQSVLIKDDKRLTGMYYDYAMAAPFMAGLSGDDEMDVLILGMGTGTYATQCGRFFGDLNIEGVEIDDKITALAYEYFELPKDTNVVTYDGRAFLNSTESLYDVIMVDAYQDITIPFQMSSVEFFSLVRGHLKDGGVMTVNMNMRGKSEGSINQYLSDTISYVFPYVYTIDVPGYTNRVLFASVNEDFPERGLENMELWAEEKDDERSAALVSWMKNIYPDIGRYERGDYLLTDDKAPVELLGMRVIDEMIKEETQYYRQVYEEQGLEGLLGAL
ncbi:MAG: fused MFS/spermidine synthase [Lachnospiraceae bacterium]|nr:fused MFS/spermidine synthase [Lachnospiraceae bacterium]